jgi:small ligand-binding sensory domain FIST
MSFAAALSTASVTSAALEEVSASALERLGGKPDLALLFYSCHHLQDAEFLAAAAQERLQPGCFLGCNGEAIVGNDLEVEDRPSLCLWLARWDRPITLTGFHMEYEKTPEGYSLLGWPDALLDADPALSAMFLFGDPFTFPPDSFLQEVNENHPGLAVMGGMASGTQSPGQARLFLGNRTISSGAVGVLIQGPLHLRSLVSQGCRPIGHHMVVTRGQENIIVELSGKPPLRQLQEMWSELAPRDRELFQEGLHVGRVINEYRDEFLPGDFLVRNVVAVDQKSGSLAITDRVRIGQTVQFHVRDAQTADEDLRALLQMDRQVQSARPQAALLFTCNGRGTRLFSQAHHDARAIRSEMGNVPLAGFFAAGEIGPVGGQNFIHGFTASVVIFDD